MTKGRKFFPPPDREGFWFRHRGADNSDAGTARTELTSTGHMLSAPFKDTGRPRPPPRPYRGRAQTSYRFVNPFSNLDNRKALQDLGEDFATGRILGHFPVAKSLQLTERDFLSHHCRAPTLFQYDSEFASSYIKKPLPTSPGSHRFPHLRPEPHSGPLRPLPTTTTDWFPDSPRQHSLGSLRASVRLQMLNRESLLKHNSWKYSFHGLPRVYPTYDPLPNKPPLDVPNSCLFVKSRKSKL